MCEDQDLAWLEDETGAVWDRVSANLKHKLPLRIDASTLFLGAFVADATGRFYEEFSSLDEAAAFVATANGEDAAVVRQRTLEQSWAMQEYLDNARRGKKTKSLFGEGSAVGKRS